jgi:hypothetical protein
MAIRSGLAAQLGVGVETTWSTAATINRFYEFNSESLQLQIERIASEGLRAGNRVMRSDRYAVGQKSVEGSVSMDVTAENFGLIFKQALGANSTANTSGSVYTHTATLGDPWGTSMSLEIGRPGNDGTVYPFLYTGAKITELSLSNSVNELLQAEVQFSARNETTGGSLTTASYPTSQELLSFAGATITIDGGAYECKDFSLTVNTGLDTDRRILGSQLINQPVAASMVEISGEVTAEFKDLSAYNRFVNASHASVVAKWEGSSISGTYKRSITATIPVARFDGETPQVGGPEILEQSLSFVGLYDGTQEPLTIATVNTDSAA